MQQLCMQHQSSRHPQQRQQLLLHATPKLLLSSAPTWHKVEDNDKEEDRHHADRVEHALILTDRAVEGVPHVVDCECGQLEQNM